MKRIIPIIMSLAAVVFGVVFVVNGISTIAHKDDYDATVKATVVDIQEEWETSADPEEPDRLVHTAYIDYEVDGKKYEHVLAPEQKDDMKIGDTVDILYQSKDPSKISAPNPAKGGIIFIVLGALVAIVGCFSAVRTLFKRQ